MSQSSQLSWFVVTTDDDAIHLSVTPSNREPWQAIIPWTSVTRVCFAAEGLEMSDGLYLFTDLRPESWAVPTEADGGTDLLNELITRDLFDAKLAIRAAQAVRGLFCWPPARDPARPA